MAIPSFPFGLPTIPEPPPEDEPIPVVFGSADQSDSGFPVMTGPAPVVPGTVPIPLDLIYTAPTRADQKTPAVLKAPATVIDSIEEPEPETGNGGALTEQTTLKATFPAWVWAAGGLGLLLLLRR